MGGNMFSADRRLDRRSRQRLNTVVGYRATRTPILPGRAVQVVNGLDQLVAKLTAPRVVWDGPAGNPTESVITELAKCSRQ